MVRVYFSNMNTSDNKKAVNSNEFRLISSEDIRFKMEYNNPSDLYNENLNITFYHHWGTWMASEEELEYNVRRFLKEHVGEDSETILKWNVKYDVTTDGDHLDSLTNIVWYCNVVLPYLT